VQFATVDDEFANLAFFASVEKFDCREMAKDATRCRDGVGGSFPSSIAGHCQAAEGRLILLYN